MPYRPAELIAVFGIAPCILAANAQAESSPSGLWRRVSLPERSAMKWRAIAARKAAQ